MIPWPSDYSRAGVISEGYSCLPNLRGVGGATARDNVKHLLFPVRRTKMDSKKKRQIPEPATNTKEVPQFTTMRIRPTY